MHPVLFNIGSFPVDGFVAMWLVGTGFAFGVWHSRMRKRGLGTLEIQAFFLVAGLGGFLLSRVWYFSENPELFTLRGLITGPGLRWHAFLISGSLTMIIGARFVGVEMGRLFDVASMAVAPGQALGRIGCILVGDTCNGKACGLPWAVTIRGAQVHPTPLYEFINLMLIFGIMLWAERRGSKPWVAAMIYLALSGLQRFVVQFWRTDPALFGPISQYHIIAFATMLVGATGLVRMSKKGLFAR